MTDSSYTDFTHPQPRPIGENRGKDGTGRTMFLEGFYFRKHPPRSLAENVEYEVISANRKGLIGDTAMSGVIGLVKLERGS